MVNLKQKYINEITPQLRDSLGFLNVMAVPRITKITLNMGVGEAVGDKKVMENAVADLEKISGQKPVVTKSRKSIAGFKIREGWPIGCKVTLRSQRMYEFLDRLISVAIPRIRDFRGVSSRTGESERAKCRTSRRTIAARESQGKTTACHVEAAERAANDAEKNDRNRKSWCCSGYEVAH